jgi:outer membrane protein assembly factor BamB
VSDPTCRHRGIRWWPAIALLGVWAVAFLTNRAWPHISRQHQVYAAGAITLVAVVALLLWWLLFSRSRWWIRLMVCMLAILAASVVRIHGVSGDLVPVIRWRWDSGALAPPTVAATIDPPGVPAGARDWPQFLGPHRDTTTDGAPLDPDWTARPPEVVWRRPVGPGWSGFAVASGLTVTQEQRGAEEMVIAYALATGEPVWSHGVRARYFTTLAGEGPRATPAIHGGHVFAQGATGVLTCLELTSGRVLWSKDIIADNGAKTPEWGFSSSPLVVGDLICVVAGGPAQRSLVAYRLADGSRAWASGDSGSTYSSPVLATIGGVRQILVFRSRAVAGHDPSNGRELWSSPWPAGHPHVAAPLVVSPDDVVISSGYGTGAARIHVERKPDGSWRAGEVWRTNKLRAKFANITVHAGHLFGLDDGTMVCLDAENGDRRWKDGEFGHGQQILAGGWLLVMAESGEIVLIDPRPDGLVELGRFRVFSQKTWNPPALAGCYLVVRNDSEACCLRLATR